MTPKLSILVALIALGQARLVRRDAPAPSPLEDLQKHAAEFQKTFSEQLNTFLKSEDTQKVNKALQEGSDSVLQQLSAFSNSLQAALGDANGKAKEALEKTRANLEKTAEELRKAHPDVEQQAGALRDKLQAAVQNTVQDAQKLAKEVANNVEATNQKLAPKIKAAYDDFTRQAQELQKKLHDAASKQ